MWCRTGREVAAWTRLACMQRWRAFNDGDVDALMDLYEPDARMVRDDGTVAVGLDEIRTVWSDLIALGGRVRMVTRYAVESGDVVAEQRGRSADGATPWPPGRRRRSLGAQDDGTWRYVIDNPFGSGTPAA